MKADFINILNELKMNSTLMKEIDLETILTMLRAYGVITDNEEYKLRSMGPKGIYELVGIILPKKVDKYMEYFIESLKIAEFTQSYEFVFTRVTNVDAPGAGVVAAGAGVAPGGVVRGVARVEVTSSEEIDFLDIYMKWLREDMEKHMGVQTIHAVQYTDFLLLNRIINVEHCALVKSKVTPAEQNQELFMRIMPNAGVHGLETFIKILKNSGQVVHSEFLDKELASKRGR